MLGLDLLFETIDDHGDRTLRAMVRGRVQALWPIECSRRPSHPRECPTARDHHKNSMFWLSCADDHGEGQELQSTTLTLTVRDCDPNT